MKTFNLESDDCENASSSIRYGTVHIYIARKEYRYVFKWTNALNNEKPGKPSDVRILDLSASTFSSGVHSPARTVTVALRRM